MEFVQSYPFISHSGSWRDGSRPRRQGEKPKETACSSQLHWNIWIVVTVLYITFSFIISRQASHMASLWYSYVVMLKNRKCVYLCNVYTTAVTKKYLVSTNQFQIWWFMTGHFPSVDDCYYKRLLSCKALNPLSCVVSRLGCYDMYSLTQKCSGVCLLYWNDFVEFQDCSMGRICTVNKVEMRGLNDWIMNVSHTLRGQRSSVTVHCKMFWPTQLTTPLLNY